MSCFREYRAMRQPMASGCALWPRRRSEKPAEFAVISGREPLAREPEIQETLLRFRVHAKTRVRNDGYFGYQTRSRCAGWPRPWIGGRLGFAGGAALRLGSGFGLGRLDCGCGLVCRFCGTGFRLGAGVLGAGGFGGAFGSMVTETLVSDCAFASAVATGFLPAADLSFPGAAFASRNPRPRRQSARGRSWSGRYRR